MESYKINLGGALLGEDLEYREEINIEYDIEKETITHIGKGFDKDGIDLRNFIAVPPLVNSHTHTADFTFPEIGVDKPLKDLVGDPKSEKYRYFEIYQNKISEGIRNFLINSKNIGVFTVVDFREQGIKGVKLGIEASSGIRDFNHILLGRLDTFSIDELRELYNSAHGYGLPSISSNSIPELIDIRRVFSDKIRAAHVSETKKHYLRHDLEQLISYYKPTLLIHGTNLSKNDFSLIREIPLVICPRSNLWFSVGIPKIADAIEEGVELLFGTDNGAWIDYNLWKEIEVALLISRSQKPLSNFAKQILKGATITAYKVFKLNYGIEESRKFLIVLLKKEELVRAHDIYTAIVKRGSNLVTYSLGATQNLK
ncbi:amidohydrolase family protein [Stygiolobus caldivivus]|uniref:Amidohydrolase-related domain-containing protein n=1 Tax=Stygiolobus caldivivus TaxID=2824673 RepID=A0A8D5ZJT2_9CREN|nr:amidohydrolase family protein [Stygiolobus caldivivus]BCU70680.1 hypothetical protein KN1_19770 [Stygiolobus caldivivus]